MKEKDTVVTTGLVVLMLMIWLGFTLHRSPRFAGSLTGGVFAVTGGMLMLVPLAYSVVKRSKRLRRIVGRKVSMRTLLAWHIYAGVLGPILVLIHTGHKFDSVLGAVLTASTLVVVASGFAGRYLMSRIARVRREKEAMLGELRSEYDHTAAAIAADPAAARRLRPMSHLFGRLTARFFLPSMELSPVNQADPMRALRLAESVSDLEHAIATHGLIQRVFRRWLKFHFTISVGLYILLGLHVWSSIHFGLRWFE